MEITKPEVATSGQQPNFQKVLRPEHVHPDLLGENVDLEGIVKALTMRSLRFKVGETLDSEGSFIEYGRYYNDILFPGASPERTFVSLGRVEIKVLKEETAIGHGVVLPKRTIIFELAADERSINLAIESIFEVFTRLETLDLAHLPIFLKEFVR